MATAVRLQRFKCFWELISPHCHLLWPLREAGQNSFQLPCKMCPYGSGQALSDLHTFWVQPLFSTNLLQMSVCVSVELHSVSLVSVSWWCVCVLFMSLFFLAFSQQCSSTTDIYIQSQSLTRFLMECPNNSHKHWGMICMSQISMSIMGNSIDILR